ncbi:MAG TPA: ABC transporter permease subunit [Gammaproteobacteria bacterium]|nr:ABC transporter permease subunit [Gammaproteobacteria bacterium]
MKNIWILCKRELSSYFATPIAYVFIVVFLLISSLATYYIGNFFARGQADLVPFFSFHPWLYMLFVPAISMRLWSEERKSGTIELLFTLPITAWEAICGKYLAALIFTALALSLTCPLWIAVNYLGSPDNGVILASYIGSLLMAGGFLAIGAAISALTKNQVIAFVLTLIACLALNLLGFPVFVDQLRAVAPGLLIDTISSFSFLTNFDTISRGLLDVRSMIYFATLIIVCLFANAVIIEAKKAD